MSTLTSLIAILSIALSGNTLTPTEQTEIPITTDNIIDVMWEQRTSQKYELIRNQNRISYLGSLAYTQDLRMDLYGNLIDTALFLPVDDNEVSSSYGHRKRPCPDCSSFHKGMDFTPGYGEPVYSITSGTVAHVGFSEAGYGRYIYIEHNINGEEFLSVYAHLETWTVLVEEGDTVTPGQQIGTVGNTGISTGPHLHFEIRDSEGEYLNPVEFFVQHYQPLTR